MSLRDLIYIFIKRSFTLELSYSVGRRWLSYGIAHQSHIKGWNWGMGSKPRLMFSKLLVAWLYLGSSWRRASDLSELILEETRVL